MRHTSLLTTYRAQFLLILLLLVALFTRFIPPHFRVDLQPWPDTPEYIEGARNILSRGAFFVTANGVNLPSRYSIGYPLLIVPVYALFGTAPTNALLLSLVLSLILIVQVYWIGKRLYNTLAGLLAAFVVVVSPVDLLLSVHMMSDVSSSVLLLASFLPLTTLQKTRSDDGLNYRIGHHWTRCLMAGGCFGYACLIRQNNVLLLPVFLVFIALTLWFPQQPLSKTARLIAKTSLLFIVGWLAFQLPILIYNQATFGSVFRTGYQYWVPYWYESSRAFSPSYMFGETNNLPGYLQALIGEPARNMYGDFAPLYDPSIALLAFASIFRNGERLLHWRGSSTRGAVCLSESAPLPLPVRFTLWSVIVTLILLVEYAAYFVRTDSRFLHIVIPLAALLAGTAAAEAITFGKKLESMKLLPAGTLRVLLVGLVVLGSIAMGRVCVASYTWKTFVTREVDINRYAYRGVPYLAYRQVLDQLPLHEGDVLISDYFGAVFFDIYYPGKCLYPLTLERSYSPDYWPPSLVMPSLEANSTAIVTALQEGHQVIFIGDPETFQRITVKLGVPLKLGVLHHENDQTNDQTHVVLYRVGLSPQD